MLVRNLFHPAKFILLVTTMLFLAMATTSLSSQGSSSPHDIAEDISCGKCGMFPAKYPQWQTQVVFTDGKMTPFDGCKCMFGFLFKMKQFDSQHSSADVAHIWVRDFKSGDWVDATKAHYVIGSDKMGPMGKELIPFADSVSAEDFQKSHGGHSAMYSDINMETLKPLMGKMHMKGKMKKKGHMDM